MLKKTILAIAFLAAVGITHADSLLEGYRYGHVQAPSDRNGKVRASCRSTSSSLMPGS